MANANFLYPISFRSMLTGDVDMDTGTFKVALVTNTYASTSDATKEAHDFYSDLTGEVANGSGYTTGGKTVTVTVNSVDTTNNRVEITLGAPADWTASSFTARGAVYYKDTGVGTTSPLIAFIDFGSDYTVSSGTFSLGASTLRWTYPTG